jgi:hypothetical protein
VEPVKLLKDAEVTNAKEPVPSKVIALEAVTEEVPVTDKSPITVKEPVTIGKY